MKLIPHFHPLVCAGLVAVAFVFPAGLSSAQNGRPARLETGSAPLSNLRPVTAPTAPVNARPAPPPLPQAPLLPTTSAALAPGALTPTGAAPTGAFDEHGHPLPFAGQTPVPAPPIGPAANVVWEDGEKDFGELIQGQVADHAFKLNNAGPGDLVISQIKPSCGCTLASTEVIDATGARVPYVTGSPIKPGSKFEVSIHFDTKTKRDAAHGQVSLYCNDPRTVVSLGFKALVKTFLNVDPIYLTLESMSTTDVREGTVTVKSTLVPKFKLMADPTLPPELKVECLPRNGDLETGASEWAVHVKLGPGVPEGTYNRNVRLLTDQPLAGAPAQPDGTPTMHETQFMLNAQVKGMVTCEPMFVSYGMLRPGQAASRSLRITCNDPAFTLPAPKLSLTTLKGEPFEYDAQLTRAVKPIENMEGRAYDIEMVCTGMPDSLNGNFIGILVIETGHPTKPKIEVRFTGVCRPGATPAAAPGIQPAPAAGQFVPAQGAAEHKPG